MSVVEGKELKRSSTTFPINFFIGLCYPLRFSIDMPNLNNLLLHSRLNERKMLTHNNLLFVLMTYWQLIVQPECLCVRMRNCFS